MKFVLFSAVAAAAAAVNSTVLHCVGDCQQPAHDSLMPKTMAIKIKQREQCLKDESCPVKAEAQAATPCVGGKAGVYECSNIDLLAFTPLAQLGGTSRANGNDIWGWEDPVSGIEYAIMGLTEGTSFVDISNPENPRVVAWVVDTLKLSTVWRDIKVYNNKAYITSESRDHGMQVVDLTRLRDMKQTTGAVTIAPDYTYAEFGSCHNMVINEDTGFGYGVGSRTCSGGLHMIDLKTPNPTFAGCFSSDGYTHDAQCVVYNGPDTRYTGREICVNFNEDTLTIVDVEDKSAPKMLSRIAYNGVAYTHQGWMTADQQYMLMDDELDELEGTNDGHTVTYVWDIRSLTAPVNTGNYKAKVMSIDHNLYIIKNRAFASNYESGLRILDTTNIASASITEVGFFDVRPESTKVAFNGAWSVYPYFKSGSIVVASIERGLFVLKFNDPAQQ